MDGRYICLLENGEQFHFYVLQVSPRIQLSQAAILSITLYVGLMFICMIILLLDRYCTRPGSVVRPERQGDQIADPMLYHRWF